LPPELQKKLDRGEALPPPWKGREGAYQPSYDRPYEDQYGYDDPYYDNYENAPEYPEDKVYRIIKDMRDLMSPFQ